MHGARHYVYLIAAQVTIETKISHKYKWREVIHRHLIRKASSLSSRSCKRRPAHMVQVAYPLSRHVHGGDVVRQEKHDNMLSQCTTNNAECILIFAPSKFMGKVAPIVEYGEIKK